MATERNYGNTSRMENIIRSRYNTSLKNATHSTEKASVMQPDCITCQKNETGIIPSNNACKLICGTTTNKTTTKL